jgi:Leucine-rich repeat (LRR) protein
MKRTLLIPAAALLFLGVGCSPQTVIVSEGDTEETQLAVVNKSVTKDLSNQGLTRVPAEFFNNASVTVLDLSDNKLEGALPAEIRQMRALEVLDASGNRMTGVPAEIGQLSNLRQLDLSNNLLTGLPYELGNLKNLELLDISGNAYSQADLDIIQKALPATTVIRR